METFIPLDQAEWADTQRDAGRPPKLTLLSAAQIKPVRINWIWPGWLAKGKVHIEGGAPGTGKTTLAMLMAAIISSGSDWPDGSRAPIGNVVIWSGEDDPGDTLVPRLMAAEADLNRVHFVGEIEDRGKTRAFDPAKDIEALAAAVRAVGGATLLIVDPIISAVAGDSHKNAEVRRALQPLADLAMAENCALLGITHFSKGTGGREPVERISGSLAFGALARIVLITAREQPSDEEGAPPPRRILARAKSNIGPDEGGFAYSLDQVELDGGIVTSVARFGERIEGTARDILSEAEEPEPQSPGDDAEDFLTTFLSDGPKPTKVIKEAAAGNGISWRTVERAKKSLGILARKDGPDGAWMWCADQDRHTVTSQKFGGLGGLGGLEQNQEVTRGVSGAGGTQDRQDRQDRHSAKTRDNGGLASTDETEVDL